MSDLCPTYNVGHFFVFHSWGGGPNPPYFFHYRERPCGPHLAGRTLQAAPCGRPLQKASTPNCRPQDKFIFIRAFYNLFSGVAPQTRLTFFIAKKVSKKASPPSFYSWSCTPNLPFFFSLQKKKAKRLAPREAIKFIFIRAFYNSLRSNK